MRGNSSPPGNVLHDLVTLVVQSLPLVTNYCGPDNNHWETLNYRFHIFVPVMFILIVLILGKNTCRNDFGDRPVYRVRLPELKTRSLSGIPTARYAIAYKKYCKKVTNQQSYSKISPLYWAGILWQHHQGVLGCKGLLHPRPSVPWTLLAANESLDKLFNLFYFSGTYSLIK